MEKSLECTGQIYKTPDRKGFVFKYGHFYEDGNHWLRCDAPGSGRLPTLQNSRRHYQTSE